MSIIIPAYNAEAYLAETLAAVQAQTYRDWEAVIADDASTDRTVEVAEAFGAPFTVLRGHTNQGPAAARNRALAQASGELLAFLDADDLWLPAYLERTVRLYEDGLARGARVGIVTSDAQILTSSGYVPKTFMGLTNPPAEVSLEKMLVANLIFGGAVAPRTLVKEAGGFCTDLFGTEDYDLWLRILELGYEVVVTREVLTIYRLHAGSVSTNTTRMAHSLQLTYQRALDRGRLTRRQERIARRQLRLQRAIERVALILAEWRAGQAPVSALARAVPILLRVGLENPNRWMSAWRTLSGDGSLLAHVGHVGR